MTPDTENMQNVRKQHNNEGSQAATSCDSNKDNIIILLIKILDNTNTIHFCGHS